jgi:hypothetical protein
MTSSSDTLFYIHDPMCSWCWGFRSVWQQLHQLGMDKASKIFYDALVGGLSQNSTFKDAKEITARKANERYGAAEQAAVIKAWCAVGVDLANCNSNPTGPILLQNGVAKTGISGTNKQQLFYTLEVPAGADNLKFVSSRGRGDADIYVKYGSKPTLRRYDCKGDDSNRSNETCNISNVRAGTYHVMVQAYSAISGVSLVGSYTSSMDDDNTPINEVVNNISVNRKKWEHYTQELPAGYSNLTITTSGNNGDADLYIRHDAQPTSSINDCESEEGGSNETCTINDPAAGTWHIRATCKNILQSAHQLSVNCQANKP